MPSAKSITKSISREACESTIHELMLTHSAQTINFHQSDSSRSRLASADPVGSVAKMGASRSISESNASAHHYVLAKASKNSGLDPLHPSSRCWFRVVEGLQMQQSMNQIMA
jgi:hypothetical protein